jgi:molybdopterin/thiamine biosynthesis adenylyltransferase
MMQDIFRHETSYRGAAAMQTLSQVRFALCGAGAIGSLLADQLSRQGAQHLRVIDFDRVQAHNANTQLYRQEDNGALKVEALRTHCFRATGLEIEAMAKRLDEHNIARLLRGVDVVVDALDNSAGRGLLSRYCRESGLACLHLGMNGGYAEARWNEDYLVPADPPTGDACQVALARSLVLLTVATGSELLLRWALHGRRESCTITLEDLCIRPAG